MMERPSSQAGRRGPRRSVAGYEHIEQTRELMTSIIHELVHTGDITALKEELKRDKKLIECVNSEDMTPLFVAVSTGNLELVQFLATSGAYLDARDNLGRTALALAAYQGWYDGVYYLLAVGADQTIVDNCGRIPLHAATYYSNEKTVEILLKHLSRESINSPDCEGMTALHWAAFHGRADLVKILVENGAEVIARDNEGKTPLHWAAQNGSVECCRTILNTIPGQHLLNGKDFSGKTPLHFAAAAGHLDALQELISEKFSNIGLGDGENRTPLHWAAATGHAHCAVALLRAGADKDCVDKNGMSPLMYAQQRGHKACSELIFSHDPDNPLHTEMPQYTEAVKVSTPPEIHIDSSPPSRIKSVKGIPNGMNASALQEKTDENKADADDNEVQEILRKTVGTVEVLVEVNNNSEKNEEEGRISSLLHDLRKSSTSDCKSPSTSPWLTTAQSNMNGHLSDGDSTGYSSDDEFRYPPQMVLTPIPGSSPIPTEDDNNNLDDPVKPPPPLPKFSFEENIHAPFLKPPATASVLAPIKPRKVPEHLRLNVGYNPPTARSFEFKPVSPSTESSLAPLKITKIKQQTAVPIKQQTLPVRQQSTPNRQLVMSPTKSQRTTGSAQSRDGSSDSSDFSRFWARKKKPDTLFKASSSSSRSKHMNRSLSIPEETRSGSGKGTSGYTDGPDFRQFDSESDFRKQKDKQPPACITGGQMLPAIASDKPNRVSQVQGSLRDQIARFRRSVKKKSSKNKSVHSMDSMDEGYEEESRPPKTKEKKKIRKVMSWNT